MTERGPFATVVLVAVALLAVAASAGAVEYRLQVVNVHDDALKSFLKVGEAADGASGPGLDRLEASLDRGDFPKAVLLYDRHLQAAREALAVAWGGVPVRAEIRKGGDGQGLWDDVRWEGKPGEHSVWVVFAEGRRPQELVRMALKGNGPMRHIRPYTVPGGGKKLEALSFPQSFLWLGEEDSGVWQTRVAPLLDLSRGLGVLVGDQMQFSADRAYIIVSHGAEPTTYKAVLAWKRRDLDKESPGFTIISRRSRR